MKKRKAYTAADEELIIRLRGEGLSEKQIAKEMGRSFVLLCRFENV